MQTVTWKSLKDVLYQLSIDDGSNTTTALVPSATPFISQVEENDDFFTPVRAQTGNIGVQGEVSIMESLLASAPADRPVVLTATKNNTTALVWKGYLQTEAFSQVWDKGPNDIALPVMSHLAIISSYNLEELGWLSFSDLIDRMSKATGTAFYTSFVFPNISNLVTVLKYRFCGERFAQYDKESSAWEYGSYRKILEEVCKVFGWVAIEQGDVLCFIAPDSNAGYYQFTAAQLATLAADGAPTPTSVSQAVVVDEIFGNEHTIDYLPGMKSVKVTGDPAPWDMDIFQLRTNGMTQSNAQDHTSYIDTDRDEYLHFLSKNYQDSSEVDITNQQNNIKLQNFIAGSDTTWTGSCLVCDREYVTNIDENPIFVRDSGWVQHIIWRTPSSSGGNAMAIITPRKQHTHNGMLSNCYLKLAGQVKRCATYKDEWETFDGSIKLKIEIGSSVVFDDAVPVVEGQICTPNAQEANCMVLLGSIYSGAIKITLQVMPVDLAPVQPPLSPSYWDYYYSMEGLTLSYIRSWEHTLTDPADENTVKHTIGNGWTEELEQSNMLTTQRPEQIGYGLILDSDLQPVASLYNSTTPENALATRMYSHYQSSKKKITVQLAGNGSMLSPLHRHIPGTGAQMMCLSQSVDWRNEQITAQLYEI